MEKNNSIDFSRICFGLSRASDEESLASFLALFSKKELMAALIPRMSDDEIKDVVDLLSRIMKQNLSEKEYHELFLGDEHHHH